MNVVHLYTKLYNIYGPQDWWPIYVLDPGLKRYRLQHELAYGIPWKKLADFYNAFRDPYFEIAVGAILAQNVSWKNVAVAIQNLYKAKALKPELIVKMNTKKLEKLLIPTRYYSQKAKKLKLFSKWLLEKHCGDILKLKKYTIQDTRYRLLAQWGIGKETADSIMLYALAEPAFVIDIYTKRLCDKYGVQFAEYDDYKNYFESRLARTGRPLRPPLRRTPPLVKGRTTTRTVRADALAKLYQEYHALIVASGQDKHTQL